jgi:hypothetical protein
MTADSIKEYAESLRTEILKRRLQCAPIEWWTDQPSETVVQVEKTEASDLSRPGADDGSADTAEAKTTEDPGVEKLENLRRSIDELLKNRT